MEAKQNKETVQEAVSSIGANIISDGISPVMADLPMSPEDPVLIKISASVRKGEEILRVKTQPIEISGVLEYFAGKFGQPRQKLAKGAGAATKTALGAIASPLASMMPSTGIDSAINELSTSIVNAPSTFASVTKQRAFKRWQKLCLSHPEVAAEIALDALVEKIGSRSAAELVKKKIEEAIGPQQA